MRADRFSILCKRDTHDLNSRCHTGSGNRAFFIGCSPFAITRGLYSISGGTVGCAKQEAGPRYLLRRVKSLFQLLQLALRSPRV
jgi:hypothetical protein